MTTLENLPPIDRVQMLHEVELLALHDSQADRPGADDNAPVGREIARWAEQRVAQIESAQAVEEEQALARVRDAEATERTAAHAAAAAAQEVSAAEQERDRLRRVLRGERRGDDGGDWSDTGRLSEDPRRGRLVDFLLYGAAAVTEVGLNYLAFRLMGTTALETAVLAAAVVLVTVLLPTQLGEMETMARRTGHRTGWPLALMLGGATLWLGVGLFVAVVRTAYLLLPATVGMQVGRPPLLALAGVSPVVLTAGWLAVAVAVGAVVLLRSARRPYASAWHATCTRLTELRTRLVAHRAAAEAAAGRTAHERDRLRTASRQVVPLISECHALAAELTARYHHLLGRRRASVGHRTVGEPGRPGRLPRSAPITPGCAAPALTTDGTGP